MNNDHFAIVVGIDHYERYDHLKGACNDAENFRQWLASTSGGNLPPENIEFILSDSGYNLPTVARINAAALRLIENSQNFNERAGKRLYIFMAGHGCSASFGSHEVLLSMPKDNNILTDKYPGVSCADYFRESALFKEIVLFMDCCRNYSAFTSTTNLGFTIRRDAAGSQHIHFLHGFATGAGQLAREREEDGRWRGTFSQFVLAGLQGAAAGVDGYVTSNTLQNYIYKAFKKLAGDTGDSSQQAEIRMQGDIVLAAPPPTLLVLLTIERQYESQSIWVFDGGDIETLIPQVHEDGVLVSFRVRKNRAYLLGCAPAHSTPIHGTHLTMRTHVIVGEKDFYHKF